MKRSDFTWEKQKLRKRICGITEYLYGSLDIVIENLADLKSKYSEYSDFMIDWDTNCDGYEEYYLYGYRLENDSEFNMRIKAQEKVLLKAKEEKKNKEARERKEYERLKRKFENG